MASTKENEKILQQARDLIQESEQINKKFADSKEKAEQEKEQLEKELQDMEQERHDAYSRYLMDEIDISEYEENTKEIKDKEEKLNAVQSKLNDMDSVQQKENQKVLEKIQAISPDVQRARNEEQAKLSDKIKKEKDKFLNKVAEIAEDDFQRLYEVEAGIERVEVGAGEKKRMYSEFKTPFVVPYGKPFGGDSVNIGFSDLHFIYEARSRDFTV